MTTNPNAGAIPPMNTLPNRLRVAREYAGLSQSELGDRAGVARNTISRAESGTRAPSRATVTVWAWACGVDADWLRNGHEKTPPPSGGGADVRHEGFEPPTFCSVVTGPVTSGNSSGTVSPLRRSNSPVAA